MLDHSSTGFMADRYTHVVPDAAKDAADRVADVFSLAASRQRRGDAAARSPRREREVSEHGRRARGD